MIPSCKASLAWSGKAWRHLHAVNPKYVWFSQASWASARTYRFPRSIWQIDRTPTYLSWLISLLILFVCGYRRLRSRSKGSSIINIYQEFLWTWLPQLGAFIKEWQITKSSQLGADFTHWPICSAERNDAPLPQVPLIMHWFVWRCTWRRHHQFGRLFYEPDLQAVRGTNHLMKSTEER